MRAHRMAGEDAPFIPGWDTHGLPIEWKVEEEYRASGRDKDAVPVLDLRDECRRYSQHWLDVQTAEFKRLGVTGDWAARYATFDYGSEAAIAAEIGKFLINGALYRGLRPVMWSPVEKTALAEAEIEYHDRTSDTVFVRFPVVDRLRPAPPRRLGGDLDHDHLDPAGQPRHRLRTSDRLRAAAGGRRRRGLAGPRRRNAPGRDGAAAGGAAGGRDHHAPSRSCLPRRGPRGRRRRAPAARPRLRPRRPAAAGGVRHHRPGHRLRAHRPVARRGGFRPRPRIWARSAGDGAG